MERLGVLLDGAFLRGSLGRSWLSIQAAASHDWLVAE
jgi:hypothetical protein